MPYVRIMRPDHPRANRDGYIYEHTAVAEAALGRILPDGAEVHHFNENKSDNRGANLVICPDHKYHALLHTRTNAFKDCGNPNWRKCPYCKQHDDPANMVIHKLKKQDDRYEHQACATAYQKRRNSK